MYHDTTGQRSLTVTAQDPMSLRFIRQSYRCVGSKEHYTFARHSDEPTSCVFQALQRGRSILFDTAPHLSNRSSNFREDMSNPFPCLLISSDNAVQYPSSSADPSDVYFRRRHNANFS